MVGEGHGQGPGAAHSLIAMVCALVGKWSSSVPVAHIQGGMAIVKSRRAMITALKRLEAVALHR